MRNYKGQNFPTLHHLITAYPDAPLSPTDAAKVAEWAKIEDKDERRIARKSYKLDENGKNPSVPVKSAEEEEDEAKDK